MTKTNHGSYLAHTKHIEVHYHFISEKVVNKDVQTNHISTHEQIADIFTKGLTTNRFLWLRDKLRVCSPPIRLRGDVRTQADIGTHVVTNYAATSTSPAHQVE
jgi:hypothetical protein